MEQKKISRAEIKRLRQILDDAASRARGRDR
jgi:hypothetical protein